MIDACWRIFVSLRLTFILLGVIFLGAVLGMSFDQTLSYEEFLSGQPDSSFARFTLSFFELNDAFHSWWFSLAIFLLAANLIACSIERLPRIFFDAVRPRPFLTDRRLAGLNLVHHLDLSDENMAKIKLSQFNKYLVKPVTCGNIKYFYYDHQIGGRFGVYIVHIALLIIMFSSVYATQNGVDAHVVIEEGHKTRFITAKGAGGVNYTHDLGFYIGCDDFRLRTFVDNSAMEFESDLFISTDHADRVASQTVRVNQPLSYAGFTFYQSSYRPLNSEKVVELKVSDGKNFNQNYRLRLGEDLVLPSGERLVAEKLFDDFAGLGQALRVGKKSPDGASSYFHIFRRYPGFDRTVRNDNYNVVLADVDQQFATGLSIGYVPGISIIFSGFLILLVGLYLCFFTVPVRYFGRIEPSIAGFRLTVAAQGFRNLTAVRDDFVKRSKSLGFKPSENNHV